MSMMISNKIVYYPKPHFQSQFPGPASTLKARAKFWAPGVSCRAARSVIFDELLLLMTYLRCLLVCLLGVSLVTGPRLSSTVSVSYYSQQTLIIDTRHLIRHSTVLLVVFSVGWYVDMLSWGKVDLFTLSDPALLTPHLNSGR